MIRLESRADVERYVQRLKNLYGEFSLFALVLLGTLIWYVLGDAALWPLWIILTWGIILFLKASKLHVVSRVYYDMAHGFREKLPFIKPEWQETKVNDLVKKLRLESGGSKKTAPVTKKPAAHKKAGVKKAKKAKIVKVAKKVVMAKAVPAKKASEKKITVKKSALKKAPKKKGKK